MIQIKNLSIQFPNTDQKAVSDLSLSIQENRIYGLMGESGSGKTITALSIMGLLKKKFPQASMNGHILYRDLDLIQLSESHLKNIRGKKISMVFQNPFTYFDPSYKINHPFHEILDRVHNDRIRSVLKSVHIRDEKRILSSYPHQLSGGQLQRLMIALALLNQPEFLIADEPTTALDPTLKWGILALLKKLKDQENLTLMIISHDIVSVSKICDWIFILYRGLLVESAPAQDILHQPLHPYTRFLLSEKAAPKTSLLNSEYSENGCPYFHACPSSKEICARRIPTDHSVEGHHVRCWLYGDSHG